MQFLEPRSPGILREMKQATITRVAHDADCPIAGLDKVWTAMGAK